MTRLSINNYYGLLFNPNHIAYCYLGGRKKAKFPVKGAIEVSSPGAGTELDADLTLNRKTPSADLPRGMSS